ncbi:MAG TPA: glycosyltransferase [Salinivirgaceae bacterium]|nr:glycosyltransferase [Salinivirgaceae bacterium]
MINTNNKKRIVYLTYDGLTDSLGQSQIIPYLKGLSKLNNRITIISAEKNEVFLRKREKIKSALDQSNIAWIPIKYTKKPPVLSTLKDIYKFSIELKKIYKNEGFDIVHCRSYVTSIVGLKFKKRYGVKFIFDMRGFWADERIDGNIWSFSNPLFRLVYKYFKNKEKEFLANADHVVSLTNNAIETINSNFGVKVLDARYSVIPCCADLDHFKKTEKSEIDRATWREKLGIEQDTFVLTYLGSLGTWYLTEEMVKFFKILVTKFCPNSVFLVVTHDNIEIIHKSVIKHQMPLDLIKTTHTDRGQLPEILTVSDAAVSFIKPSFSKKASSPTKLAELFGLGIPVFSNIGVGDIEEYYKPIQSLIVKDFKYETLYSVWNSYFSSEKINEKTLVDIAHKYFSLNLGVERYNNIYKSINN